MTHFHPCELIQPEGTQTFCQLSLMCFDQLTENGHIYCTVCSLQQQQCLSLGSQRTLTGRSQQDTNQVKSFTFDLLFNLMGL